MASKKEKSEEGNLVPQLTFKKAAFDPKECIRQKKQVYLGSVFGEMAGLKVKEAKSGDTYTILIGQFRIVNEVNKEMYESEKAILPGSIQETLEATFNSGGSKPVVFGYDVYATPSDNTVGYQYAVKTLIKSEASDRLTEIQAEIDSRRKEQKG